MGIRELREAQVLTQRELAARAGVSNKTLSDIEQFKVRPHAATLRKLARALNVKPSDLGEHYALRQSK